ncbi:MAG: dTDP-4-dehydrorhamnose reductase [Candidatus Omnitrophota bacterium]|nr:dTDP-4-dehydrorhamnose reductase [Candidatus Omnitrophota bacterium]
MQKRYKILITGSSGMLGHDLCRELGESYDVAGLDRIPDRKSAAPVFFRGDITDKKRAIEVISKVMPDIVIHAAAWTDVDGCEIDKKKAYLVNSEGTKNVALACAKFKAFLIYVSTDFVFDGRKKSPYKEGDRPKPLSVYGMSKVRGERFVKKYLKRYFIVRTSWLYGRRGNNFVDTILSKAKSEKTIRVVDDQIGSPTFTKDLSRALHVLLDIIYGMEFQNRSSLSPLGERVRVRGLSSASRVPRSTDYGIYHISNSGSVTWYEYAKQILRSAGCGTRVVPVSSRELARPAGRPAMSAMDNSKFSSLTGCRMRNWKRALKDYLTKQEG